MYSHILHTLYLFADTEVIVLVYTKPVNSLVTKNKKNFIWSKLAWKVITHVDKPVNTTGYPELQ